MEGWEVDALRPPLNKAFHQGNGRAASPGSAGGGMGGTGGKLLCFPSPPEVDGAFSSSAEATMIIWLRLRGGRQELGRGTGRLAAGKGRPEWLGPAAALPPPEMGGPHVAISRTRLLFYLQGRGVGACAFHGGRGQTGRQ